MTGQYSTTHRIPQNSCGAKRRMQKCGMVRDKERYRLRLVPLLICQRQEAPPAEASNCCWAAYRQTQWSWLEAKRRNQVSRRRAVRMSCASAAELAHSLDAGGRQGEWRSEAACEAPRPLGHRTLAPGRGGSGVDARLRVSPASSFTTRRAPVAPSARRCNTTRCPSTARKKQRPRLLSLSPCKSTRMLHSK